MAQQRKPATKSKTTAKSKSTSAKSKQNTASSQAWSVILFSLGILLFMLTVIEGTALWKWIHDTMRGLFGWSVFLIAPITLYVAIMIALDKSHSAVITKVIQGFVLLLLVSAIAQVIVEGHFTGKSFPLMIKQLFSDGKNLTGGGVCSVILGGTLFKLFGRIGASVIIILLAFTFIILITDLTLIDIFKAITKPFRSGYTAVKENNEERAQRIAIAKAEAEKLRAEKNRKNAKVDLTKYIADTPDDSSDSDQIDLFSTPTEEPVHPVKAPKITRKKLEETAKKTDDPQLKKAIEMAVLADPTEPLKNPIFVEEDGQTCLYEKDNSTISLYKIPPVTLLAMPKNQTSQMAYKSETEMNSETLVDTLKSFGVVTRIVATHRGPSVTRYELQPAAGVKVSKITNLADDIALNLAAQGVRIEAPIPGKAAVGIEIPNQTRDTVTIRELIDSDAYRRAKGKLSFAVGKDIEGEIVIGDISKMPHMLIAGTTGSGKSVFTNSIIMNILYRSSPQDVRLILIDPKQVEFPIYNGIPHLLIPVVTDARKAAGALNWSVTEMLKRYKIFADSGVRDLADYNEYIKDKENMEPLPQIVIIVDELADLMMAAPKEVEESICRIAQLARAAGMHLIIATQSPRVDVVTGLIKANIPSRVALKVSNNTDSRVILDEGGAEKLLGNGDLLYKPVGLGKPVRIQGSFVPTSEVRAVVEFLKNVEEAKYDENIVDEIERSIPVPKGEKPSGDDSSVASGDDDILESAIRVLVDEGKASTSLLQRKLKLGYGRAARIMDELEQMGIIGEPDGAKPRKVLMSKQEWLERETRKEG